MGLDNFWVLPEGKEEISFSPELHLCGGMFSGHGQGSFRGKVYDEIVSEITGVSLYTDEIDNQTIQEMADKLVKTKYDRQLFDCTEEEFRDLRVMFSVYADAGASLKSWY